MLNKLIFLFLATFGIASMAQGQSDLFALWPDTALAKANAAEEEPYLSEEEKQVIYYINLVRMNPPLFEETILESYLDTADIKKSKELKELRKSLRASSAKQLLAPSKLLTDLAREHAKDMGTTGRTGHNASDGTTFKERMQVAAAAHNGLNENANYGYKNGLAIVIDLLIDEDVPHAGHRRNILDPEMLFIGVAIETHRRYGFNCVQDFGGAKRN